MGINKLFKIYPKSFTRAGRNMLNDLAKDKCKID